MEKFGILGGTFDPVHGEHLSIARCAVKELSLDRLFVCPTFISPHKSAASASPGDRLEMLRAAFRGEDKIEVSDYEISKGGKSYTYITVEEFKKRYGGRLYFIVGGDMLNDFGNWKYPERILSACDVAAFCRDGITVDFDERERFFREKFGKTFYKLSYEGKGVSSTKVRVYRSFGLPLSGLLPEEVEKYITSHGLYRGDKYCEYIIRNLPEKRIRHTADVVVAALARAKAFGIDAEKARIAATLHDCAKYLDAEKTEGFTMPDGVPQPVRHAFLGAYIAETRLGIKDEEILDAIRYHTSGKPGMSPLSKLVFVADMIEDGRDYDGVDRLRSLYYEKSLDESFAQCLKEEVIHLINKKSAIYGVTLDAYDYYLKRR